MASVREQASRDSKVTDRGRRWFRTLLAVLAGILFVAAGAIGWRVRQVDRIEAQLWREGIMVSKVTYASPFAEVPVVGRIAYVLQGKTSVGRPAFGPPLTDADWTRVLPLLKQLPPVAAIWLHGTALSQRSLATFGEFPALETVALTRCQVSDADIGALATCPRLRELRLEETAVTGSGLSSLAGVRTLSSLTLDGSPVSEEGIDAISQLGQLTSLSLSNVGLAESEIMRLEEALPGILISDD